MYYGHGSGREGADMSDAFGEALRDLRRRAGLSLADLANAMNYSKAMVVKVEVGERTATLDFAEACDRALGTTPLLAMLCEHRGDDLRRRSLLMGFGALAAGGAAGYTGLQEVVRHALNSAAGVNDWDALVADHAATLVSAPSEEYGPQVLGDLMLLLHLIHETPDRDKFRAAAGLANFHGLHLGNQGSTENLRAARRYYRSAGYLADQSGDIHLASYIRGRTAARATYEGATIAQTEAAIAQIMATTGGAPSIGTLEAYSTEASLAGLIGDVDRGRKAVRGMWEVADALPADADPWGAAGPVPRAAFLGAFVEARCGTLASTQTAVQTALPLLDDWAMWRAEVEQYWARALVADGDVAAGVAHALTAAQATPHGARVVKVAVRDVIDQVPAGWTSPELEQLRPYASVEPGPWETIR